MDWTCRNAETKVMSDTHAYKHKDDAKPDRLLCKILSALLQAAGSVLFFGVCECLALRRGFLSCDVTCPTDSHEPVHVFTVKAEGCYESSDPFSSAPQFNGPV